MDLRDLEKLADVAASSHDHYALADFGWHRLRPVQELIARFFDDAQGRACLATAERMVLTFNSTARHGGSVVAPNVGPIVVPDDVTSTEVGLLFGWIAQVLELPVDGALWTHGDGWAEVRLGTMVARFERRERADVRSGALLSLSLQCGAARFEIERLDDPGVLRWSREVPGTQVPPQTVRVVVAEEAAMLRRCMERPKRDFLLEASLHAASRAVRSVAPRLG